MKRLEVPLLFNEKPTWPSLSEPPSLQYSAAPYKPSGGATAQNALKDRLVLTPDIDLNRYRCKAVLDWVEIRLETKAKHQALNVQKSAVSVLSSSGSSSSVYVSGPRRKPGYLGSDFIIRVQQPEPRELLNLCREMVKKYQPGSRSIHHLEIVGLEVSVDCTVIDQSNLNQDAQNLLRWQMTDLLRRHLEVVLDFGPICSLIKMDQVFI